MTYCVYCLKSSQLNTYPPIPNAVCSKQQTNSCTQTKINFAYDNRRCSLHALKQSGKLSIRLIPSKIKSECVLMHSYHLDKSSSLLMWQICNDRGERVEKRRHNPLVRMQHINTVFCCSTFASVDRFSNVLRKRKKDRKLAAYSRDAIRNMFSVTLFCFVQLHTSKHTEESERQ